MKSSFNRSVRPIRIFCAFFCLVGTSGSCSANDFGYGSNAPQNVGVSGINFFNKGAYEGEKDYIARIARKCNLPPGVDNSAVFSRSNHIVDNELQFLTLLDAHVQNIPAIKQESKSFAAFQMKDLNRRLENIDHSIREIQDLLSFSMDHYAGGHGGEKISDRVAEFKDLIKEQKETRHSMITGMLRDIYSLLYFDTPMVYTNTGPVTPPSGLFYITGCRAFWSDEGFSSNSYGPLEYETNEHKFKARKMALEATFNSSNSAPQKSAKYKLDIDIEGLQKKHHAIVHHKTDYSQFIEKSPDSTPTESSWDSNTKAKSSAASFNVKQQDVIDHFLVPSDKPVEEVDEGYITLYGQPAAEDSDDSKDDNPSFTQGDAWVENDNWDGAGTERSSFYVEPEEKTNNQKESTNLWEPGTSIDKGVNDSSYTEDVKWGGDSDSDDWANGG